MIFLQILLLVVGFLMLVKGADWFVEGAAGIAEKFGIPQLVVGLTIVAMGTSAPEAAVSITAALKENAGISVGNVVGSNILNVLIILGVTGVITSLAVQKSTLIAEIPYMLVVTAVLLIMGLTGNSINRVEGAILWIMFIAYLVYLYFLAKKGTEGESKEERSVWKLLIYGIVGGVIVVWGSDITVDAATYIAETVGLSQRFIGLTIVAFGTSLPEFVTSVTAARKGNADIAIGNIVGSNVFNILFVLGTSSLIIPLTFEGNFLIDTVVAIVAGVILWISVAKSKKLTRPWGFVMLLAYAGYLLYLFVM